MSMSKSLTSAVSGLKNHQTMMDVIGNNVANVNTPGYRSSKVVFSDVYYQTISSATGGTTDSGGTNAKQVGYGSAIAAICVNNDNSGYNETSRALDCYIDGDGYFIIKDEAGGNTSYSKLGNFYFDAAGNLVDYNGNFVCDNSGAVINCSTLSTLSNVSINANGEITGVASDDSITDIGTIGLATFANVDGLIQSGNGYYLASANSGPADTTAATGDSAVGSIVSGALESSNVDLTDEFTNMIVAQRGYQANARVITTSDSILEELVNLKR